MRSLELSLACCNYEHRLWHFNGVDVVQAGYHITSPVEIHWKFVFQSHGCTHLIPAFLPMNPSNDFVQSLNDAAPLSPDRENIWTRHILDSGQPLMNLYGLWCPLCLIFLFLLSNLVVLKFSRINKI